MATALRPQFDPAGEYLALREIVVGDRVFPPGEPFDKSLVTERRLRQMYDNRTLTMKDDGESTSRTRRRSPLGQNKLRKPRDARTA